jgi:hypothetical protein
MNFIFPTCEGRKEACRHALILINTSLFRLFLSDSDNAVKKKSGSAKEF